MGQDDSPQQNDTPSPPTSVSLWIWIRSFLIIGGLPAIILLGSAGTFDWPMAWIYIIVSIVSFAISRYIVWRSNPDLLVERGRMMDHENTASFDRILSPLLAFVGPTLIGVIAGFAIRFSWQPTFPPWLEWTGVILMILGNAFGTWALIENRFFSGVVRIQKDRGHHVVSTGPYAIIRHPGYSSAFVSYLGMVLMLGSPWALIPFVFQQVVLVTRTALEDKLLQAELPGYVEYTQQTRYRLIPGIW